MKISILVTQKWRKMKKNLPILKRKTKVTWFFTFFSLQENFPVKNFLLRPEFCKEEICEENRKEPNRKIFPARGFHLKFFKILKFKFITFLKFVHFFSIIFMIFYIYFNHYFFVASAKKISREKKIVKSTFSSEKLLFLFSLIFFK